MDLRSLFRPDRRVAARVPWRSRLGVAVLVALALPTAVLAWLSIQSVRSRAVVDRTLLEETYASIARLVAAELDSEVRRIEATVARSMTRQGFDRRAVVSGYRRSKGGVEGVGPVAVLDHEWNPVVPRSATGEVLRSARGTRPGGDPATWLARAKTAEDPHEVARALDAAGRAALAAGENREAIAAYRRLRELATPFDPTLADWGVVARGQLIQACECAGDPRGVGEGVVDLLGTLVRDRWLIDPELHAHYRRLVDLYVQRILGEREADGPVAETRDRIRRLLEEEREEGPEVARMEAIAVALAGLRKPEDVGDVAAPGVRAGEAVRPGPISVPLAEPGEGMVAFVPVGGADEAPEGGSRVRRIALGGVSGEGAEGDAAAKGDPDGLGPTPGGRSRHYIGILWTTERIRERLAELLAEDGPWRDAEVLLLGANGRALWSSQRAGADDPAAGGVGVDAAGEAARDPLSASAPLAGLPLWRLAARPAQGSLQEQADREIWGHAIFLGLVFVTTVVGLALAARSLSREVALAQLRSDFVANVSHELKTPLTLIRMFAENLREGLVPRDRVPEYYDVMVRESERLTGLINNVLDFSKIESGSREYRFETVDLRDLVRDVVDRYREHLDSLDVRLEVALREGPLRARVDADAIDQVLVNLMSNATKYLGDGERRVRVEAGRDGSAATLVVADTGIGIDADDLEAIFDPFFRADDDAVRSAKGNGIGLTILASIVEAHDGEVEVDSTPGRGSTFTVRLPLVGDTVPEPGDTSGITGTLPADVAADGAERTS